MLVAMFVILMATATATFAIHSTAYEVQAAGHHRRATQTQYVGETGAVSAMSWVDFYGPSAMLRVMKQQSEMRRGSDAIIDFEQFNEPPLADVDRDGIPDKDAYRLFQSQPNGVEDFNFGSELPVDREAMGGNRQAFEPLMIIDIYDHYEWHRPRPGYRSDGGGTIKFLFSTYTSRGRTRVAGGDATDDSGRQLHESASNARAYAVTGPYGGG